MQVLTFIPGLGAAVAAYPYAAFFVMPVLGSVGLPIPEDAILFLLGMVAARGGVMLLPAAVCVYAGILASDLIIYAVGATYGRRIVTHRLFGRLLPPGKLTAAERAFGRSGPMIFLLGRQIFWLRAKIFLVAGITRMPLRKFLLLDMASALVTVGVMVSCGFTGDIWMARLAPLLSCLGGLNPLLLILGVLLLVGGIVLVHRQRPGWLPIQLRDRFREQLP